MLRWLIENSATILISLGILVALFFVVRKMVKARKKGGCATCSGCPYYNECNKAKKMNQEPPQ